MKGALEPLGRRDALDSKECRGPKIVQRYKDTKYPNSPQITVPWSLGRSTRAACGETLTLTSIATVDPEAIRVCVCVCVCVCVSWTKVPPQRSFHGNLTTVVPGHLVSGDSLVPCRFLCQVIDLVWRQANSFVWFVAILWCQTK